jgi:hypothetical protein
MKRLTGPNTDSSVCQATHITNFAPATTEIRRVKFEIGAQPIPMRVSPADVDDDLGAFVEGEPQWSR